MGADFFCGPSGQVKKVGGDCLQGAPQEGHEKALYTKFKLHAVGRTKNEERKVN